MVDTHALLTASTGGIVCGRHVLRDVLMRVFDVAVCGG